MVRKAVVFAILLIAFESIEGATMYGKCAKFGPGEEKPVLENADMYCISDGGFEYCLKFDCPPPDCMNPLTPTEGNCQYCQGTCSYGGTVYKAGDSFRCLDGTNQCSCGENNSIASTRVAQNHKVMCKERRGGQGSGSSSGSGSDEV